MRDGFGREIDYLRVSVTDRCNLRCVYCMPAQGIQPVRHEDVLSFEELLRICRCGAALGMKKVKLTGGEPLVRRGLPELVRSVKALPGIEQVTLTSNGVLLRDALPALEQAGLDAVNISLDTLDETRYNAITRGQGLPLVLAAIDDAMARGIRVKLNCVPVRELSGDGLLALAELARTRALDVRFIELMPIGCGQGLTPIPSGELMEKLTAAFGPLSPCAERRGNGPAHYVRPAGFLGCIGFVDAVSGCFCGACNRVRLTSTGFLKLCLHHAVGVDLRALLRGGAGDEALLAAMRAAILEKPARQQFGEAIADAERRGMSQIGG